MFSHTVYSHKDILFKRVIIHKTLKVGIRIRGISYIKVRQKSISNSIIGWIILYKKIYLLFYYLN